MFGPPTSQSTTTCQITPTRPVRTWCLQLCPAGERPDLDTLAMARPCPGSHIGAPLAAMPSVRLGRPAEGRNCRDPEVPGWQSDAMKIVSSDPVLAVHDLDKTSAWFTRVLGCERSDPDPANWTFCRAGTVTFMLGRCPDVVPASELGDHNYVAYLTVENVDDYHARGFRASRSPKSPDGRALGTARDGIAIARRSSIHARRTNPRPQRLTPLTVLRRSSERRR